VYDLEKEQITPHVKEIARVLEGKATEEEILAEMDTYLNVYRVSVDAAKRGIIRKLGGDPSALPTEGSVKKVEELLGDEKSVDMLARVVSVNRKEITVDGRSKEILYGIFGDETGTVPFTAWDVDRVSLEKGEVYCVRNAYATSWNGKPQLNLGSRVDVEKRAKEDVPMPQGRVGDVQGEVKMSSLTEGMNNVTVTGRILKIEPKDITVKGEPKTVYNGLLADETGKVQFTAWHDFSLKDDEVVRIDNAYVKGWRGIPQLNFGERSQIERVTEDFASSFELEGPKTRSIASLERAGGGVDVLVSGTIVDVKRGSGLIHRCPECNRLVQKNECMVHGKVRGLPDLRIKAVLDDGTAALTAILNREITESLTGIDLDTALEEARDSMDPELVKERMEEKLVGRTVEVRGNASSDEYGLMLVASGTKLRKTDVRKEAQDLLVKLEGSL
jgi:replication factor A1